MIPLVSDDISGKDFLAAEGVQGWRFINDGARAFYPLEDPTGNQADIASG